MKTAGCLRRFLALVLSLALSVVLAPTLSLAEALGDAVLADDGAVEVLVEELSDEEAEAEVVELGEESSELAELAPAEEAEPAAEAAAPDDEEALKPTADPSGKWGTCPWRIESDGTLYIEAGTGKDIHAYDDIPWYPYRESIKKVETEYDTYYGGIIPLVVLPKYSYQLFYNCKWLTYANLYGFDTRNAEHMGHMFNGCESLWALDLSGFDTSKVTNMTGMFASCSSLEFILGLDEFDTSKVDDMKSMFYGCKALSNLDLSSFDTPRLSEMSYMFTWCESLTYLDLSTFDTSGVDSMAELFNHCTSLEYLDVSSFDTRRVTNMNSMFGNCTSLTSLDLSSFNTSKVTSMRYTFGQCRSLASLTLGPDFSFVKAAEAGNTGKMPEYEVNGHEDWWSTKDKAWYTGLQIENERKGIADTYTKPLDVAGATVAKVADQAYTGSAIKPSPKVTLGSETLKKGTDYTLSYKNNVKVGTATITVTGMGAYVGTKSVTFKIVPASIAKASMASVGDKAYTGSAIKPAPAVKLGSRTLKKGTDYTLSYKNNVNVGTATVTATGKGNYTGTKSVTFKIKAVSIDKATVSAIDDIVYTGKAIKPSPTIKLGSKTLKKDTDYTLSYKDNVNVGTAVVTITGKGNFKGERTVTFRIAFTDVPKSHQFYEKIHLAVGVGIIEGYAREKTGQFGPNDNITRGQIAVILWRMAGKKAAGAGARSFPDVKPGAYYYEAVRWASSVGVVSGYRTGKFGPNDDITREQLAVMIANYASKIGGIKVSGSAKDYAGVADAAKVSSFARPSVGWCYKKGMFVLQSGKLNPTKTADRATAAQMAYDLFVLLK